MGLVLLSGCAGLPCQRQFPTDRLWEFDPKYQTCAEYKVIDFERLLFGFVREVPMEQCPAIFGFTHDQIPKVLDWGRKQIQCAKEKCKK